MKMLYNFHDGKAFFDNYATLALASKKQICETRHK